MSASCRPRCGRDFLLPLCSLLACAPLLTAWSQTDEGEAGGAPAGWVSIARARKAEGNVIFTVDLGDRNGFAVLVAHAETGRTVHIACREGHLSASLLPTGAEIDDLPVRTIEPPIDALDNLTGRNEVIVKFRSDVWSVYAGERLLGHISPPFAPPATLYWPEHAKDQVIDRVRFQPAGPEHFRSDFMVEEGAPSQLYPWEIQSGSWAIHTVLEDAIDQAGDNLSRVKQVPPEPGRSPNFYCVKGKGTPGVITTGYDFYDDYEYAAAVHCNDGEAGLVFYYRESGDYYAFTLSVSDEPTRHGILDLRRVVGDETTVLARARTELFTQQWYMPRVRVYHDTIRCYLDNYPVISVQESLPSGGRVGLYVGADQEVRFDDVYLENIRELDVSTAEMVRLHTFRHRGTFYKEDQGFWRKGTPDGQRELRPKKTDALQELVLGRPFHAGVVFTAELEPTRLPFSGGLSVGVGDEAAGHFRFGYERSAEREVFRLSQVGEEETTVITEWERPCERGTESIRLMSDLSRPGQMRFYAGDELVIVNPCKDKLTGGAGVFLDPESQAVFRGLRYAFLRDDVHEERQQPNEIFRTDPFMRHWSAPEGEWLADAEGIHWHKGDFFAGFKVDFMAVDGARLDLGVKEGEKHGHVRLSVKDSTLSISIGDDPEKPVAQHEADLAGLEQKVDPPPEGQAVPAAPTPKQYLLDVNCEDRWLWVGCGDRTLVRTRLPAPLQGTRVCARGVSLATLSRTIVTRRNVMDEFFNESPYNWIVNGGKWQIINRFQCQPRWSHMSGESADNMAALWHKYRYSGDLTLEFYAGVRHGDAWYQRAGDLDCAIFARTTAPDSGYAVTCTQWDYNESQKWSTFFRRGAVLDRSDKYLVPRRRAGNVRKYLNPLVSTGRPIHGAWYYIKFRRIGSRVEYYFDNELIFSLDDPEPLDEGLIGLWTFMNSMMIARVRISYEHAEALPLRIDRLPPDGPIPSDSPETTEDAAGAFAILASGVPLDSLDRKHWTMDDPTGQALLRSDQLDAAALWIENRLGSGTMFAQSDLPSLPQNTIAGWQLFLKRSANAPVNIHYTTGAVDESGKYTPGHNYFHHVSGTDFTLGAYTMTGATVVPPAIDFRDPEGDWSFAEVWIPTAFRQGGESASAARVRFEGFGNRQLNSIIGGIGGAFPGAGYAVRRLTPVFYGAPSLTTSATPPEETRFTLERFVDGGRIMATQKVAEINEWMAGNSAPGINRFRLTTRVGRGSPRTHDLAWVHLPDQVDFSLTKHESIPDTVVLRNLAGYPDPRFAQAEVRIGDRALALEPGDGESRLARLPRSGGTLSGGTGEITFTVNTGAGSQNVTLRWPDSGPNDPPVLVQLDGLTPLWEGFETDNMERSLYSPDWSRMSIQSGPATRGRFLNVANRTLNQRMVAYVGLGFSVARYPVMQAEYRASDMAYLTGMFNTGYHVRLGEEYSPAVQARLGSDLVLDGAWHTWIGNVGDVFTGSALDLGRFVPAYLQFGSLSSVDQTGKYSDWDLNNIVFGPAIAKAEQLRFVPRYFDVDGVKQVSVAILAGEQPLATRPEATRELAWQAFEPGAELVPALGQLPDGVHHLVIKATDVRDGESVPTDVPFLLDTGPLAAQGVTEVVDSPLMNGVRLRVTLGNGGGSPWQSDKATFLANGKPLKLYAWTNHYTHSSESEQLALNYPFVLRQALDAANDGDAIQFTVDNIVDGAGNATPALTVPVKVDYSNDKRGPAWYNVELADTVLWHWHSEGLQNTGSPLSPYTYTTVAVAHDEEGNAFQRIQAAYQYAYVWRELSWPVGKFPWLSLRMRLEAYKAGDPAYVRLLLYTTNGRYMILLGDKSPASSSKTIIYRDGSIDWSDGSWRRFSFNIGAMLSAVSSTLENAEVKKLTLQRIRPEVATQILDVDDICIHATPAVGQGVKDTLNWTAYDASGVGALRATCIAPDGSEKWTETVTDHTMDLSPLRARAEGASWLRCQAIDKPGNASVPIWLPFPAVPVAAP